MFAQNRTERKGGVTVGPEDPFGGDGFVCYLDCGDGFMVCPDIRTHQVVHFKYVHFMERQLYFNDVLEKRYMLFSFSD